MFCSIDLNLVQVFNLFLFDNVPNNGIEQVQVSEDFAIGEHSGDCVVTDFYVGLVAT